MKSTTKFQRLQLSVWSSVQFVSKKMLKNTCQGADDWGNGIHIWIFHKYHYITKPKNVVEPKLNSLLQNLFFDRIFFFFIFQSASHSQRAGGVGRSGRTRPSVTWLTRVRAPKFWSVTTTTQKSFISSDLPQESSAGPSQKPTFTRKCCCLTIRAFQRLS